MRILITRPLEDADATANILRARGHEAVVVPLLEIRDCKDVAIPDEAQAILASSANGIRALAKNTPRRDRRVFAVGAQTAQAAKQLGFPDVLSANGDAADLAQLVIESGWPKNKPLLHAAGRDTRGDLSQTLQRAGFSVAVVTLYEAVAATELPSDVDVQSIDAALFYSPRSASIFAALAQKARMDCANIVACCISTATADSLSPVRFREVRVAPHPSQQALLALID